MVNGRPDIARVRMDRYERRTDPSLREANYAVPGASALPDRCVDLFPHAGGRTRPLSSTAFPPPVWISRMKAEIDPNGPLS